MMGIRISISTTSGLRAFCLAYRLDAVRGLADDAEIGSRVDEHPEPGPDQGLVVGDQHPDLTLWTRHRAAAGIAPHRRRSSAGSRATTAKPPSGRAPAVSWPPSIAARSRIPAIPRPGGPGDGCAGPGPSSVTVMVSDG